MKKVSILLSFVFSVVFVAAQTEKNNWLVGGNAGFTSSTEHLSDNSGYSYKTTQFQITPDLGYFIIHNLAAGVNVSFSSVHSTESNSAETGSNTSTSFAAGPFLRYYIDAGNRVKIFVHADANWGSFKPGSEEDNMKTSMYEFKAGPAFFLNPHVALEFTAGFQSMKYSNSGSSSTTNTIAIGVGFQIHLGQSKK